MALGVPADPYVRSVTISAEPGVSGDVELRFANGLGRVKIYDNADRSGQHSFPHAWPISSLPKTVYLEGVVVSDCLADIALELTYAGAPEPSCKNRVRLTVYQGRNGDITNHDAFSPSPRRTI